MNNMMAVRQLLLLLTLVGIALPINSWAQRAEESQRAEGALEEIIVTARKREESLQETPISISAFSGVELDARQIHSADQLKEIIPNFSFESSAGSKDTAQIYIRGIGQAEFAPVSDPGVGLYVDDVYMARAVGSILEFVDVESIEVLRGPQGTLFGRNSVGGAILVHSRKPGNEFGGDLEFATGNDDKIYATVRVDLPVSDSLRTRHTFTRRVRDGYVTNVATGNSMGDEDMWGWHSSIIWEPVDHFRAHVTGDYTHKDENGPAVVSGGINDLQTFAAVVNLFNPACPVTSLAPPARETNGNPNCANETANLGPFLNGGTFPSFHKFKGYGFSATLSWDITDFLELKSITGYRYFDRENSRDADNSPFDVFATEDIFKEKQWTEEIQLSGKSFDNRLLWVVGGYLFTEDANNINPAFTPLGDLIAGGKVNNDAWALFGQGSYDITEKLSFTFGMRYSDDHREFFPDQPVTAAGLLCPGFAVPPPIRCLPVGATFVPRQNFKINFDNFSTMQSLAYQWNNDLMTYFTRSEGFKSGGFDSRFVTVADEPTSFNPETATNYEIGVKSEWLDSHLRVNLAVFHTDYDDIHLTTRQNINPATFNGGAVEMEGLELEAVFVPTINWQLSAAIGYIDAEYTSLSPEAIAAGVDFGNKLQQTPEFTANLNAAYTFTLGEWGTLTPRVDYYYNSGEENDPENTVFNGVPLLKQDSYDLVHAAATFRTFDEKWEVTLAGRNLTDELYLINGASAFSRGSSFLEYLYNRPREWSLTVKYHF